MPAPTGLIFDIRRYAVHDGPGIRTTVFLKGCPLSCWWCHNPESQSAEPQLMFREARCAHCGACAQACPQAAIAWQGGLPVTEAARCTRCGACTRACPAGARELTGQDLNVPQVMALLRRDVAFFDQSGGGVTLSGGEPLDQPEFSAALLRACQAEDIHTALDTCGYAPWEVLDEVRTHTDLFLYDVKLMDDDLHRRYTGVSNRLILENLRRLAGLGHKIILRVPLIPGITDGEDNLRAIAELARSLPNTPRVDLLPYHDAARLKYQRLGIAYPLPAGAALDAGRPQQLARILQEYQLETRIGG